MKIISLLVPFDLDETRPDLTVLVRQGVVTVVAGGTAELVCYVDGSRPQLVWSRSGGLPVGSTQTNGVLTIPNIQLSGGGRYICTAIAQTGERGTVTTTITVNPEVIGECSLLGEGSMQPWKGPKNCYKWFEIYIKDQLKWESCYKCLKILNHEVILE